MGATNTKHRPLVSGILIRSGKKVGNQLQSIASGTLTGLATRNSDGKRVLVTNLHVMTGSVQTNPSGNEEMYQESVISMYARPTTTPTCSAMDCSSNSSTT